MIISFFKETALLTPQIDFLLVLQNFRNSAGAFLTPFFVFITLFGEIIIPIAFMAGLYWCIDKKNGIFLLLLSSYTTLFNQLIKMTFCIYRPWIINSLVQPPTSVIPMAHGYSFPSGHTATAVATWGGMAYKFWKNKALRYSLITLILFVAFSRNYLGVHTPQDVIISALVTVILIFAVDKMLLWEEGGKKRDIAILTGTFALTALAVVYVFLKSYPIDYLNGAVLIEPNPLKLKIFARTGFLFGSFIGWLAEKRLLNFDAKKGSCLNKILRFLVGILFLLIIYLLFEELEKYTGTVGEFICYFIFGIYITFLYPLAFVHFEKFKAKNYFSKESK